MSDLHYRNVFSQSVHKIQLLLCTCFPEIKNKLIYASDTSYRGYLERVASCSKRSRVRICLIGTSSENSVETCLLLTLNSQIGRFGR